MQPELVLVGKFFTAVFAAVRPVISMGHLVSHKTGETGTRLVTNVAGELVAGGMKREVIFQRIATEKLLAAEVAREQLGVVMDMHVTDGVGQVLEAQVTRFALERLVVTVDVRVIFQLVLIDERLIAQRTDERVRARVDFQLVTA